MTDSEFDGEGVLRYLMTNFDVIEEDNRIGEHRVFSTNRSTRETGREGPPPPPSPGMAHRLPQSVQVQPLTILGHLHGACRAVIFKRNHHAALFVAHFMRASGHLVKQLSFKDDLQETVLQVVMEVATRRESFNLQTREFVLKSAMESTMFSQSQRERLMERLANMWGEDIWSTENGAMNYPVSYFENDKTKYTTDIGDPFDVTDLGNDAAGRGTGTPPDDENIVVGIPGNRGNPPHQPMSKEHGILQEIREMNEEDSDLTAAKTGNDLIQPPAGVSDGQE